MERYVAVRNLTPRKIEYFEIKFRLTKIPEELGGVRNKMILLYKLKWLLSRQKKIVNGNAQGQTSHDDTG